MYVNDNLVVTLLGHLFWQVSSIHAMHLGVENRRKSTENHVPKASYLMIMIITLIVIMKHHSESSNMFCWFWRSLHFGMTGNTEAEYKRMRVHKNEHDARVTFIFLDFVLSYVGYTMYLPLQEYAYISSKVQKEKQNKTKTRLAMDVEKSSSPVFASLL